MNILDNINAAWNKLGFIQRALISGIVLGCIGVVIFITSVAGKHDMRVLYSSVPLDEMATMCDKLSESGINYEINGSSIRVKSSQLNQARIELAKEGLPVSERGGYDILDSQGIGLSPSVMEINTNRAIQDEIARRIEIVEGVKIAKVLLVSPEQTLFSETDIEAKASVVLKMKPGWRLSPGNIAAITNVVASSVPGLKSSNVTIMDSNGTLLSLNDDEFNNGASTYLDYKERVENNLAKKVQQMLDTVLGPGRSSIKVSAVVNMTAITTEQTEYDTKGVPIKENITSTSTTNNDVNAGDNPVALSEEKQEEIETENLIGKTVTQKVETPGEIKEITVAAVVDLSMPEVATPVSTDGEKTTETTTPATTATGPAQMVMTIDEVKNLIKNAIGKDLIKTNESLTVVNAPFTKTRQKAFPDFDVEPEGLPWPKIIEISKQASPAIMAICALIALKILMGGGKKKSSDSEVSPDALATGQTTAGMLGAVAAGTNMNMSLPYRDQISNALKQNPDQVKQLFASWLGEED